ncbi:AraC family transcriptional regulator [Povalibacter sp.]|uniref:AraC family transcriptional regulator n=1 Tax=Povalibacter sp. TaxID=1962978 RepID=UPI002F3FB6FF
MTESVDRLDALLQRFSVTARMFHAGALCGITEYPATPDVGQLHLIRRGPVQAQHGSRRREDIEVPSVVFYPRPLRHKFITDKRSGADLACAHVLFNAAAINPIAQALPAVVVMPLTDIDGADSLLEGLFREAFTQQCGRRHIVNRLFEVVLILIVRTLMNRGDVAHGMLAGMSHPRLARALIAMHEAPGSNWTLDELANRAGMSRSHFAATFHDVVRTPPGDYLLHYRISVVQDLLRRGESLKNIAGAVGYGSTAALSRAFSGVAGKSPREWRAALEAS